MATVFDSIILKGIKAGEIPARERSAREWYRKAATKVVQVEPLKLLRIEPDRFKSTIRLGDMYLYHYDPKYKATLPYYDRFPLVFPFKKVENGWLGINMHYLPLPFRAKLMDALYSLSSSDKYDDQTRLKLTYDLLNGAAKFKYVKPTIHRYLISKLKSRLVYIHPSEWDIAIMLPVQRFYSDGKKIPAQTVYKDSRATIKGS